MTNPPAPTAPVTLPTLSEPGLETRKKHRAVLPRRRSVVQWALSLGPSSILIGFVSTLVMLVRLFVPFATGLADSGDGERVMCQLGLVPATDAPRYWSGALLDWVPGASSAGCADVPSSGVWVLHAIQWVTGVFGAADGTMNLRFLLLGYALLAGILIGGFAFLVRRNLGTRITLSVLLLIVLSDGLFANYAGSVFGESAGIIGIAIMAVAGIFLGTTGIKQWVGLAGFTGGAILALASNAQAFTLLLPIMVLLVCTTLRIRTPDRGQWWAPKRLALTVAGKVVPVAVALALVLPALWAANTPKPIQPVEPWQFIAVDILGTSPDPAADLAEMGFPKELAAYAGKSVFAEPSIITSPDWEPNTHLMTYQTAATFLLAHPDRAVTIINQAGNDWFESRPNYLGSYEQTAGVNPGQQDASLTTDLGRLLKGFGVIPLLLIWAAIAWGGIRLLHRSRPGTIRHGFATTVLLLLGLAIVQFCTIALSGTTETTRHFVYGIQAQTLAIVLLITGACTTRIRDSHPDALDASPA